MRHDEKKRKVGFSQIERQGRKNQVVPLVHRPIGMTMCLSLMSGLSGCQSLPANPHTEDSLSVNQRLQTIYGNERVDDRGVNDDDLARAITEQNELHPDLSGYHPIVTGENAFAARSMLTQMAKKSIDVQYYIWHNDQAGQLLLKDLWEAAERGVMVRLLLDDFNNNKKLDATLLRFASHPNITVRYMNPMVHRTVPMLNYVTDFRRINHRMHNKSMTFDRQISIIGGRNIGNEYLSNSKTSQFADLDVILIGQVVADISESFADYWASPLAFDVQTVVDKDTVHEVTDGKDASSDFLANLDQINPDGSGDVVSSLSVYKRVIEDSTIDTDLINKRVPFRWTSMQFLVDDVSKIAQTADPNTYLVQQLRTLLGKPTKELTIISSYFVPTDTGANTLIQLAQQGVKVRILTNSFHATDVTAVHSGYAEWRKPMLEAGITLYELKATASEEDRENKLWRARSQSSTSLHAKTFAVDDHNVFIGSYNVDPRSANINTEMGVLINDDELARQLHNALGKDLLKQSYKVTLGDSGNLQWETLQDGKPVVLTKEPYIDLADKIWLGIMSHLPIDWLL